MILTQESTVTLMPVLLRNGLMDGSFCGGRGDCGRCVVQFLEGAPFPTGLERSRLEPEELRQGYRLACVTRPKTDCTIRIVRSEEKETPIVTEINPLSENIDLNSQKSNLSVNQKSSAMKSSSPENADKEKNVRYIIAVDLGTTTIAMQLRDAETGSVADTYCEMNPQRKYGTDVLARIQASVEGQGEELRRLVCGAVLRGLGQFAKNLHGEILCMCVAGNTAMEHLLLGYEAASLGRAPFMPVEKGLQKITAARLFAGMENSEESLCVRGIGTDFDFPVYIAPCISAFVGGDIVAGLYALGLLSPWHSESGGTPGKAEGTAELSNDGCYERMPMSGKQTVLFIDLGTNGEMAITDGRRMIVTATAAGPAFEGDGTVIGTDRIALTARLLQRGILDETGLLEEPYFTEGVRLENGKGDGCYFKQENIRSLQMAKAAVRAGVEILWEEMGRPEIGKVCLAGGFGYYLDVEAAVTIGLLPAYMRGRVQAVGNTSLAGAYELGRDLSADRMDDAGLEERTALAESINLAELERFEGLYLKYMSLEEN
ncbi:MAG: ASKHA domain-containing protein [Lachnospiraceae bacterium]|nr:ASKHA domain-containing protein [Lachnospiraceae bacterium]